MRCLALRATATEAVVLHFSPPSAQDFYVGLGTKVETAMLRIWILAAVAVFLTSLTGPQAMAAETTFCWKETWGTGVGVVPQNCPDGSEKLGVFCYEECPVGFQRVSTGCHAICPAGSKDDGFFCGWHSYIAARYTSHSTCTDKHGGSGNGGRHTNGCVKRGLLWFEECEGGYKNVLGFCEKINIDCHAYQNGGRKLFRETRIANSCPKVVWAGKPEIGQCADGYEMDAGLCYRQCGENADRVGPLCWGTCPAGWVSCGMGCAKDQAACDTAVRDQVLSVVDATVSIALLAATAGAGSSIKTGGNVMKKAWRGLIDKVADSGKAKLKALVANQLTSLGVNAPSMAARGIVDFVTGFEDIDGSDMTEVEKDHKKAEIALTLIGTIDPTGVVNVMNTYKKPVCHQTHVSEAGGLRIARRAREAELAAEHKDLEEAYDAKRFEVANRKHDLEMILSVKDQFKSDEAREAIDLLISRFKTQLDDDEVRLEQAGIELKAANDRKHEYQRETAGLAR